MVYSFATCSVFWLALVVGEVDVNVNVWFVVCVIVYEEKLICISRA